METRRVQVTGGSSYIVTLPKKWIEKEKLTKNDPVYIDISADGSLNIRTSDITSDPRERITTIDVNLVSDYDLILGRAIAAYVTGSNIISISSDYELPSTVLSLVEIFEKCFVDMTSELIGNKFIQIKENHNATAANPLKNMMRMKILLKEMLSELIESMLCGNKIEKKLTEKTIEIGCIGMLISRQSHICQHSHSQYHSSGISSNDVIEYHLTSKIIENMANIICELNNHLRFINDPIAIESIGRLLKEMEFSELITNPIESIILKDVVSAESHICKCKTAIENLPKIDETGRYFVENKDLILSYMIISTVKRIIDNSIELSQIAINSSTREQQ